MNKPKGPDVPDSAESLTEEPTDEAIRAMVRGAAKSFFDANKGTEEEPGITERIEKLEKREELERKATELLARYISKNAIDIRDIKARTHPEQQEAQTASLQRILESYAHDQMEILCETTLEIDKHMKTDAKTNLLNRAALDSDLAEEIERHKRQIGDQFSLMFIDLDHFTQINSDHGHVMADQVLIEVARRLKHGSSLRRLDRVYRFGGEEFCVLLPTTSFKGAAIVADRISKNIRVPIEVVKEGERATINVTASIGISQYTDFDHDSTGEGLIAHADNGTYVCKGKRPDSDGLIADRRGQIACDAYSIANEGREGLLPTNALLTPGRKMNRAVGIDSDAVIVTPEMIEAYRASYPHENGEAGKKRETKRRPSNVPPSMKG